MDHLGAVEPPAEFGVETAKPLRTGKCGVGNFRLGWASFTLRYKKIPLHDVFSRNCSETICIYNKHGNTPDSSRVGHSEYVC